MPLTVTGQIGSMLSGQDVNGRIEIDAWGLGTEPKSGLCVLNLYSQGTNYPEILEPTAVAGTIAVLVAARGSGAKVYYWPGSDSVLFVGTFMT